MDWNQANNEVRELFYQCRFKQAVAAVDLYCAGDPSDADRFTLLLRKSMALFEMHKVAESKQVLRELTQFQQKQSDAYLYATARLAYMDQEYEQAERLFKLLADRSETVKDYFQSALGLANVYFSLRLPQEVSRLIHEMEELSDLVNLDQRISLNLLKAMVSDRFDQDTTLAKKYFQASIREALPQNWNYFAIKSLYGLACLYKDKGKLEALEANLDLLKCYLDPEECVYLTYLVNEKFKDLDYSLNCSLHMDPELRRISVQGKWIALHDKPLIYDFLELLHIRGSFVGKAEIAARLWGDEEYKPRTHDPRIFDLARRIRALIEPYENQPVCLLSGRQGYKLAGRDKALPLTDANQTDRRHAHEHRQAPQ